MPAMLLCLQTLLILLASCNCHCSFSSQSGAVADIIKNRSLEFKASTLTFLWPETSLPKLISFTRKLFHHKGGASTDSSATMGKILKSSSENSIKQDNENSIGHSAGSSTGKNSDSSVRNVTENFIGNSTDSFVGNSMENSTRNSTENLIGNNTGSSIQQNGNFMGNSTESSTEYSNEQSIGNGTKNSIKYGTEGPAGQSSDNFIGNSTESSIKHDAENSLEHNTDSSLQHSTEKSTGHSSNSFLGHSSDSSLGHSSDSYLGHSSVSSLGHSSESPERQGTGNLIQDITESPIRHSSDSSLRHNSETSRGPNTSTENQTTQTHTTFKHFEVNAQDCTNDYNDGIFMDFFALQGEVTGVQRGDFNLTRLICKWKIRVPENLYVIAAVQIITADVCFYNMHLEVSYGQPFWTYRVVRLNDQHSTTSALLPDSSVVYFKLKANNLVQRFPEFQITFRATQERLWETLIINRTLTFSGSIFPPGYDGRIGYAPRMDATQSLELPENHTLMISFEKFEIYIEYRCADSLTLFKLDNSKNGQTQLWQKCKTQYVFPEMYEFSIKLRFYSNSHLSKAGFKMRFTIHPYNDSPCLVGSGLFNCSTYNYITFKNHMHCNMKQECEGREDEGGFCPFSSPACDGAVAALNKCYTLFKTEKRTSALKHKLKCLQRNSTLVMTKTQEERRVFDSLLQYITKADKISIGMSGYKPSMPQYYRRTLLWMDGSVPYTTNMWNRYTATLEHEIAVPSLCVAHLPQRCNKILIDSCHMLATSYYICERKADQMYADENGDSGSILYPPIQLSLIHDPHNGFAGPRLYLPVQLNVTDDSQNGVIGSKLNSSTSSFQTSNLSFVVCSLGHFTLEMLACFPDSNCGVTKPRSQCPFSSLHHTSNSDLPSHSLAPVNMFRCEKLGTVIPYNFVCDFHEDCKDHSDEDFCVHNPLCSRFRCKNGQCIDLDLRCDTFRHCEDGSDETVCHTLSHWVYPRKLAVLPPAVIDFDGSGLFSQQPMNERDQCPSTHVRCAGDQDYCVPVYVRCNGVWDCVHHQDEAGCDTATTCPGFYRCWHSPVCLHATHLCDGWPQCPRHDDELLCDMTCPVSCGCQGQAFVCHQPFPAQRFPKLTYLDATGSGMTLHDVRDNSYLVSLVLTSCGISLLPSLSLSNLNFLTLSDNVLTDVNMNALLGLLNLRVFNLAGNPLTSMYSHKSTKTLNHLNEVDISRASIPTFDSSMFVNFPQIRVLNISFSDTKKISENGFVFLPQLQRLDITGNHIKEYPVKVFRPLSELTFLSASDFRLCCRDNLPEHVDSILCLSPQNEISSCEDLLQSNLYRAFLWLLSIMAVVGNGGSFVFRSMTQTTMSRSSFNVFVTHLCVSDLLMGVYLMTVGAADSLYRGQYLWYQTIWMTSIPCHGAGFLSLLSSEVSAFIICLITLDRFIALRFPFSTLRFRWKSAMLTSLLVWAAGVMIAVIPLLPMTSHWEFYGNTGICVPLPITRNTFQGRDYSFGVTIVVNFVLFVVIAVGQLVIYWSIKSNLMVTDNSRKGQDMTMARRLLTVVLSDFACWFPIGVLGLLASAGVAVPGEINVAVAIFVLPLNSALNPFLYTLNILLEKQRQHQENNLMKVLKERLKIMDDIGESRNSQPGNNEETSILSINNVVHFLGQSLLCQKITMEEVRDFLVNYEPNLKLHSKNLVKNTQ